ncbi:MAG: hypothetical protein V4538_11485 [Bacteroidota bacterium]
MRFYYSVMLCLGAIITNAQIVKLPDSLYKSNNSLHAEIAYEQAIYNNTDNVTNQYKILFEKARYLKTIKNYPKAIETLVRINENELDDSIKFSYYYQLAILNYLTDNNAEVDLNLTKIKYFINDTSYNRERIVLLDILNLNRSQKWEEAKQLLIQLNKGKMDSNSIHQLYKNALHFKPKSTKTAQALQTFLPGTGHMYVGKTTHGIINATLILSGLAWGAYNVFNGYYVTGVFSGFFISYAFYGGGINYAVSNAIQYNQVKVDAINKELNNSIITTFN